MKHHIDGVIATNTTIARTGIEHLPAAQESGGLSGAPLTQRATAVIQQLHHHAAGRHAGYRRRRDLCRRMTMHRQAGGRRKPGTAVYRSDLSAALTLVKEIARGCLR
jgi:hypothetical protein